MAQNFVQTVFFKILKIQSCVKFSELMIKLTKFLTMTVERKGANM
jgi:hypothetical protein